jgi:hypothetical protein
VLKFRGFKEIRRNTGIPFGSIFFASSTSAKTARKSTEISEASKYSNETPIPEFTATSRRRFTNLRKIPIENRICTEQLDVIWEKIGKGKGSYSKISGVMAVGSSLQQAKHQHRQLREPQAFGSGIWICITSSHRPSGGQ